MSRVPLRRVAYVWYCGDEVCDCSQATVEDVFPHPTAGPRFVRRETVAQGTFFTSGEGWPTTEIERDHLALLYGAEVEA